jgi:CMP-N,N'-diacetyllegionaminic acid synthase
MIGGKRVIAVVPARAGSKSVKDKNIHPLGGKPLLAWPIEVAKATKEIDRVIVSTDGDRIAEVARRCGAEIYDRPAALAGDRALVIDALRDLIARLRLEGEKAAYMVLLEATSPLRLPEDVTRCLTMLDGEGLDSVATFTEPQLNPHRAWRIEAGRPRPFIEGADPWQPRQALPEAWQLNGAVYAFVADHLPAQGASLLFGKAGAVIMPRARSVDIDDAIDFVRVEAMLKESRHVA